MEPYDGVGECEQFQLNEGSCTQPLHSVEECKHKKTDEESDIKEENDVERYSLTLSLRRIQIEVLN